MIQVSLDKLLEQKEISRYELAKRTGIQYQIIDNYYKNLERICEALDCDICDVLEYKK